MDLSIVIVNWNTRDILLRCLASIYEGRGKRAFEVWVVDNGSTDGSPEAVRERFPRARLIENKKNLGFARANNQALRKIKSPYVALLNSDTLLTPGAVDTIVDFMDGSPDVGICGPQLLNEDGTKQNSIANIPGLATEVLNKSLLRRLLPGRYPGKELDIKEPMEVESIIGACMVVRRKAMEEVGLLDEDFFFFLEETDWCKKMREKGWRVFHHPGSRAYHLQGGSAKLVNVRARVEYWRSRYTFFKKHRGWPARVVLRAGLFLRLTASFLLTLFYNVLTLFMLKNAREGLKLRSALIAWHIAWCPASWGLGGPGGVNRKKPLDKDMEGVFRYEPFNGGWKIVYNEKECTGGLLKNIRDVLSITQMPGEWTPLRSSQASKVWKFYFGGEWYVFKEFSPRGPLEFFKSLIKGTRAERAWNGGYILLGRGFLTPSVLARGVKARWGLPTRNFLLTRFVPDTCGLGTILKERVGTLPPEKRLQVKLGLMQRLGRTIGRLHSGGIFHGDLRPDNILVRGWDGDEPCFYFIDNERNSLFEKVPHNLMVKNLVQLNMVHLSLLSRTDRMRFFLAYLSRHPAKLPEKHSLAGEVWAVTEYRMGKKHGGLANLY
jgi:GT2 family glycosyltransferase